MEQSSISHSPSALNRSITELTSADNGTAFHGDQSSLDVEVSTPLSPSENPVVLAAAVPSSKEKGEIAEIVSGNLASGEQSLVCFQKEANSFPWKSMPDCNTICDVLCENMQEIEGDCVLVTRERDTSNGAANAKPKEEISASDFPEIRAIRSGGESGGVANGKAKQEATGLKVLGAASGKLSQKIDAVGGDVGCSLEIELIDDTAVIGISTIGRELGTVARKNKKVLQPVKEKKPRRRSRPTRKDSDENKNSSNLKVSNGKSTEKGLRYKRTEKVKKTEYSRKTMEAMRFWNVKGQRKLWKKIYDAFSPTIRTEYEEMGGGFWPQNKPSGLSWDTNRAPGVLVTGMAGSRGRGRCLNYYMGQDKLPGYLWARRNFV